MTEDLTLKTAFLPTRPLRDRMIMLVGMVSFPGQVALDDINIAIVLGVSPVDVERLGTELASEGILSKEPTTVTVDQGALPEVQA